VANMNNFEFLEESEMVHRMPTSRPLTRPHTARISRNFDAMQNSSAMRQVEADKNTSLKTAEHFRDATSAITTQTLEWRHELEHQKIQAFKNKQQQRLTQRADKYYSKDMQKTQDRESRFRYNHDEHLEAHAQRAEVREYHGRLNRNNKRSAETYSGLCEQHRSQQAHNEAAQHRAQSQENNRRQLEQERLRKAGNMDAWYKEHQSDKGNQHIADLTRKIEHSQARMMQLTADKRHWQVACNNREMTRQELVIDEKIEIEGERLALLGKGLRVAFGEVSTRPKSAFDRPTSTKCYATAGGIAAYSSDTPRRVAPVFYDATRLGPRISEVGHKQQWAQRER